MKGVAELKRRDFTAPRTTPLPGFHWLSALGVGSSFCSERLSHYRPNIPQDDWSKEGSIVFRPASNPSHSPPPSARLTGWSLG